MWVATTITQFVEVLSNVISVLSGEKKLGTSSNNPQLVLFMTDYYENQYDSPKCLSSGIKNDKQMIFLEWDSL